VAPRCLPRGAWCATGSHLFRAPNGQKVEIGHQPAGRTSPAAGVNEQNLTSIFDFTLGHYGLGLADFNTLSKGARCPFDRTSFYCRAVSIFDANQCRSFGAKIPRPAFEGTGVGGRSGQAGDTRSWPWTADQSNHLVSRVAPCPGIRAPIVFLCQFVSLMYSSQRSHRLPLQAKF
jgi:hypothetical protein